MSTSSNVTRALVDRLKTVTQANGYAVTVVKVFYPLGNQDFQVMGGELSEPDMPALIVYQGPVDVDPEHGKLDMRSQVHIELVRPFCSDDDMWTMVEAVCRAIFGGTAGSESNTSYRFHPAVVEPKLMGIIPDFGMLQGNRIWVITLLVHYRAKYTAI